MTDYIATSADLTTVADAIRTKGGTSAPLVFPNGFATAIANIPTGTPTLETKSKTYTATESQQTDQVTPSVGYDGLDKVNVTINAIPSNYVGSGITQRTSSDLSASGATVTAPAGYYASNATKSVASGTAGTPTATKSAVSNHSLTVTPSVTNTTGYITGSTQTGTAVTVSASELVSGSQNITTNNTYDVTNLASVVVNVSGGGGSSDYTHIYSTTFTVSTTSTSAITVGTVETGDTSIWTSNKMVYVKIRDTAGRRDGYYYGSDCFICNSTPGNGGTGTSNYNVYGTSYHQGTNGSLLNMNIQRTTAAAAPSGYGVYPTHIYDDGSITIKARYTTSTSYPTDTIDGTFKVDVYLLNWPGGTNPWTE